MLKQRHLQVTVQAMAVASFMISQPGWCQEAPAEPAPQADSVVYRVDRASRLLVQTAKAGLFGGLGHDHKVRAQAFGGTVVYFPAEVERSRVSATVLTDSLFVVPEADSADIPEITQALRGQTLRVDSFPEIGFVSRKVEWVGERSAPEAGAAAGTEGPKTLRVTGDLTMVGRTRPVSVDLRLALSADTLRAEGSFVVKQTDFGIKPYGKALGLVKVKNEVRFELHVVAIRAF